MSSSDEFRGKKELRRISGSLLHLAQHVIHASTIIPPPGFFLDTTSLPLPLPLRPEIQLYIAKSPSSFPFKYPHLSPALTIAYHHVVSHPCLTSINHPPHPRIPFTFRPIQSPQQHII